MKIKIFYKKMINRSFYLLFFICYFLLYSCNSKMVPQDSKCEVLGTPATNDTDPGNYYYVMQMSKENYKKFRKPPTFKRFIFQFRNIKNEKGRNDFELDSYGWYKGVLIKDELREKMFLERSPAFPKPYQLEPKGSFTIPNLELRRKDIKKDDFEEINSILLIPYYDDCFKCIMVKLVGDPKSKDEGIKENNKRGRAVVLVNPCPPDRPQ